MGYDINYYFWKDVDNKFISFIINYNIKQKIIIEFKADFDGNDIFNSANLSIPL